MAHHPRLSVQELAKIESLAKAGKTATEILNALEKVRERAGLTGPSKSAVHRFVNGNTYNRDAVETRGRPASVTPKVLKVLDKERKKLLKEVDNEYTVTWDDVCDASKQPLRKAKLLGARAKMWFADWVAKTMRTQSQP